jgi:hypothetical protein
MEINFASKNTNKKDNFLVTSKNLCFEKLDIDQFVQTGKIWKNCYKESNLNSFTYIPCQNK